MKLIHFHRKPISMFVMFTFTILLCFWANQVPAAPAAPAAEKNSKATLEQGESGSPNFIEEESESAATVKKPKKFPWLLVGAVVVVGAAALYFLVLNKKYTLTVTLGAGTAGTPTTAKYKKNEVVPYSFSAQAGYVNLKVMLDDAAVAPTGTVTMDKNHTIITSATLGATIQVNSSPAGAKIYLNKVDSGQVTPYTFSYTTSTTKEVLLRLCGYQDWTKTVTANLGQEVVVNHTLQKGIHEDFAIPASSCWSPANASDWSTGGGFYKYSGTTPNWNYSFYNQSFDSNYTVTVKMQRKAGNPDNSNCIFLATSNNMTAASGYIFQYSAAARSYGIWQATNWNPITDVGSWKWIKDWTSHSAISGGLGQWNTLKIIKAASNFTFYINNILVYSVTNSTYNPKYVVLLLYIGNISTQMNYDYVYLSPGSTAGSIPGQPASFVTAPDRDQKNKSPH